jgi:hypothetical protein
VSRRLLPAEMPKAARTTGQLVQVAAVAATRDKLARLVFLGRSDRGGSAIVRRDEGARDPRRGEQISGRGPHDEEVELLKSNQPRCQPEEQDLERPWIV